jgi:hypothetical protein
VVGRKGIQALTTRLQEDKYTYNYTEVERVDLRQWLRFVKHVVKCGKSDVKHGTS